MTMESYSTMLMYFYVFATSFPLTFSDLHDLCDRVVFSSLLCLISSQQSLWVSDVGHALKTIVCTCVFEMSQTRAALIKVCMTFHYFQSIIKVPVASSYRGVLLGCQRSTQSCKNEPTVVNSL